MEKLCEDRIAKSISLGPPRVLPQDGIEDQSLTALDQRLVSLVCGVEVEVDQERLDIRFATSEVVLGAATLGNDAGRTEGPRDGGVAAVIAENVVAVGKNKTGLRQAVNEEVPPPWCHRCGFRTEWTRDETKKKKKREGWECVCRNVSY